MAEKDNEYQKFFKSAMKKFGIESPEDFKSESEKKKFFDYVDKNWKSKKESNFINSDVNEAQAVSGGKVHKFITGKNLTIKGKKYPNIEFEVLKIDNTSQLVKLKVLAPNELFGHEFNVPFKTIRRGPFLKTNTTEKIGEKSKMKKLTENRLRKIVRRLVEEQLGEVDIESVNEGDVKKKINRRGDVDGLIVTHKGNDYEIVYSGDFSMSSAVQPYGIVMPGDDVVSFLGKDKRAKSIWKQLKPKVDKFLNQMNQ